MTTQTNQRDRENKKNKETRMHCDMSMLCVSVTLTSDKHNCQKTASGKISLLHHRERRWQLVSYSMASIFLSHNLIIIYLPWCALLAIFTRRSHTFFFFCQFDCRGYWIGIVGMSMPKRMRLISRWKPSFTVTVDLTCSDAYRHHILRTEH